MSNISDLIGVGRYNTINFKNKTMNDVTNFVGANHIHYKIKATEDLVKGDVVKITGYNSGEDAVEVAKISAASDVAFGVSECSIANGSFGKIVHNGNIESMDTSAWTENTILYSNGAGGFTDVKPTSGDYQALAVVLKSNANIGAIYFATSEPQKVSDTAATEDTIALRGTGGTLKVADAVNDDEALSKQQLVTTTPLAGSNVEQVSGTPKNLLGIGGDGYSWVDETTNRALDTVYTNDTGKPIFVKATLGDDGGSPNYFHSYFYIDDVRVDYKGANSIGASVSFTVGGIVPNGSTYKATTSSDDGTKVTAWFELK